MARDPIAASSALISERDGGNSSSVKWCVGGIGQRRHGEGAGAPARSMSRTRLRTDDREAEQPAPPLPRRALDRRALACLAVGLLMLAGGLVAALSHGAQRRTGTNGVWPQFAAGEPAPGQRACQDGELLPAGTGEAQI